MCSLKVHPHLVLVCQHLAFLQLLPPPPPPITSTAGAGLTLSDTHSTVSRINLQQRANSSTLESANVRQAFQHQMAMNNGDLSSAAALRTGSLQEQVRFGAIANARRVELAYTSRRFLL